MYVERHKRCGLLARSQACSALCNDERDRDYSITFWANYDDFCQNSYRYGFGSDKCSIERTRTSF